MEHTSSKQSVSHKRKTAQSPAAALWCTVKYTAIDAFRSLKAWLGRVWKAFRALPLDRQRLIAAIAVFAAALLLFAIALTVGVSACVKGNVAAPAMVAAGAPEPDQNPIAVVNAPSGGSESDPQQGDSTEALPTPEPIGTNEQTEPGDEPDDEPDGEPNDEPDAEPTAEPLMLKKHDERPEVMDLQKRLIQLGYLDIDEPTEYYGSATEYAVKLFQRQHGLTMDGVAGTRTLELIYSKEAQKYTLMEGAEGRDVKMLQEQLCDLGYLTSSQVDSVYGTVTTEAVKAFQKRNKLTVDGKAGEKTLDKLYSDDAKVSESLAAKQKAEEEAAAKKAKEEAAKQKESDKKAKEAEKKAQEQAAKDKKIDKFISVAKSKIGCEYVLGSRGPDTFDCSGFVYYCLRQAGVSTTRLNAAGYSKKSSWTEIKSYSNVQRGDILFFRSDDSSRVSHTGIYIGDGMMIDASSGNGKVVKRAVSSYWKRNFVNARRPW